MKVHAPHSVGVSKGNGCACLVLNRILFSRLRNS